MHGLETMNRMESEVRGYVRAFPVVFERAHGSTLIDEDGREYLDFFAGAGVLNYGHNNPAFIEALQQYLADGGIMHGLDMATVAKRNFLELLDEKILKPRGLDYKVQFTGPTGANVVEAALKVARQATGRSNVVAFTNGFHGLSMGALAATANAKYRRAGGATLPEVTRLPYDRYLGEDFDTLDLFEKMLEDTGSGLDLPAAVIVETIQGEGGLNAARPEWLKRLREITERHEILLIIDDIQAGVGRSGNFFSFEESSIVPDLVTVSKSLSASGLPMSILLMKPEVDVWEPGAHTGTFRGNNLAFVTAAKALELYWSNDDFAAEVRRKHDVLKTRLSALATDFPAAEFEVRGRGLMMGIASMKMPELAGKVSAAAFQRGLIIETSGAQDEVLKFLPSLTITDEELEHGLAIVRECLEELVK